MKAFKRFLMVVGLLALLVPVLALSFLILSMVDPSAVVWGVVIMVLVGVWLLVRRRGAGNNPESGSMFNRSKEGLL